MQIELPTIRIPNQLNKVTVRHARGGQLVRAETGYNSLTMRSTYSNGGLVPNSTQDMPAPSGGKLWARLHPNVVDYTFDTSATQGYPNAAETNVDVTDHPDGGLQKYMEFTIAIAAAGTYKSVVVHTGNTSSGRAAAYYVLQEDLVVDAGDTVTIEYTVVVPYAYQNNWPGVFDTFHNGPIQVAMLDVDGSQTGVEEHHCIVELPRQPRILNTVVWSLNIQERVWESNQHRITSDPQEPGRYQPIPNNAVTTGRTVNGTYEVVDMQPLEHESGEYAFTARKATYRLNISAGGPDLPLAAISVPLGGSSSASAGKGVRIFLDPPLVVPGNSSFNLEITMKTEWDPPQGYLDKYPDWERPAD